MGCQIDAHNVTGGPWGHRAWGLPTKFRPETRDCSKIGGGGRSVDRAAFDIDRIVDSAMEILGFEEFEIFQLTVKIRGDVRSFDYSRGSEACRRKDARFRWVPLHSDLTSPTEVTGRTSAILG
jgi:hypothetical protein